ncbi:MAG TPA: hypothetical protein VE467_20670 [Chryseolinea sp.]|jgi:hypothetical protein|nr:hypothetical protein [Chryseolinea sp.]
MSTFEELKNVWKAADESKLIHEPYDRKTFQNIIKSRMKNNMKKSMNYFWGSFFLQILVYALLSNVILKYGRDVETLMFGIGGILLFLPFTIVLLKKFKRMAIAKPEDRNSRKSLYQYVLLQHTLLESFFVFKKRYEMLLGPLSTAIGVFLTFRLFVPGGVAEHPIGAVITFFITIITLVVSTRMENKRSFEQPLWDLKQLLNDFKTEE